jgi:hypothetical protein
MSDSNTGDGESTSGASLRTGSDALTEGVSKMGSGISEILLSLWTRFDNRPILRGVVTAVITGFIARVALGLLGILYIYFFAEAAVISRDVSVQTFPLPLGLSTWLLWGSVLFISVLAYFRMVELRQRIEELEARVEA